MFSLQVLLGRVCTIADLHTKELPVASRLSDKAIFDFSCNRVGTDHLAHHYLKELLLEISKAGGGELLPVAVEGCGFCLTHSISKFLFGIEIFYHVMRSKIHLELEENAAWYLGKSNLALDTTPVGKIFGASSLNSLPESKSHENVLHLYPAFTVEEYDELLSAAVLTYADQAEWSPFEHCQMISNILKRPLCLFTSLADLNSGEAFTFLPLRHPPEVCYKYPISLAWQQRGENNSLSHFVPLCRVDDTSAPVIPVHCQPPLYRCTKEIARKYINYNADLSFTIGVPVPCCDIESTHLLKTMGCRYKPHKLSQPGFFHGLIDKLTTSACAELSSENVLGNLLSSCSLSGEKKIDFTLVKGMISVDLLIKLYVSRIGFDAVAAAVLSEKSAEQEQELIDESKILEALQDISDNILKEYSEKLTGNGEKKNTFKLELDQHIVMSMQRMMSLTVVRYSARTEYIQYLLSYHICQLVQNEFEKFHSQILKKIVASARATSALISPLNPTFSSSQISTTSSPLSRFSPSRDRYSITTSSSLKIIGSNGSSSSSYDRKNDINNNEDIIQSYHTAPSDSDILALDCLAQCLQLSMEYRTHSDHSLKLKLSLYQIEKCSTAFSQSDRYSSGLAGHVLYDINSDNNFLKGNITCVGGDSFERNLRYLNVTKNCSNDAIISNVIDRKRKVEHSHDKFDS